MRYYYAFFFLIIAINIQAQFNSPTQWTTTFKDLGDNKLEITFDANIKENWYTYSQFLESEDGPIPTSINFEVSGITVLSNKETTSLSSNRTDDLDPIFKMKLIKFKKDLKITLEISYTQLPVKGYLTYMTGDSQRLYPPNDVDFAYHKDGTTLSSPKQFNFRRTQIIESLDKRPEVSSPLNINNPLYKYLSALKKAKEENKPLLVVFTGYGCVNALKMEENIYTKEPINSILSKVYTVVHLYVDDRKQLEQAILSQDGLTLKTKGQCWANFQATNFKTQSQPYFAILNSKEEVLTIPRGYTSDAKSFETFLKEGIEAYNQNH